MTSAKPEHQDTEHKPLHQSSEQNISAKPSIFYTPETEATGGANFLEDENTKIFARKVADHYSARSNQTLEEREANPIIHLKKLNNWGGDLIK
ncbi:hypothetical protein VIGAN_01073500 [Vigna angularis var. angularis]|uniref:mRNA cap 0 methyltransferase domain-containing protein n=1 Tax=Vigna angularis var. angularis TaxID=157739 RepID=A0A0S3QYA7_PHAAN|nr:hypothetical protein VIGAN_01073500 [Vigna angularis var. angularis]